MLKDDKLVEVYNYNNFTVIMPTANKSYTFEPSRDGIPTTNMIPFSDIKYVNSRSNAIRTGMLAFDDDIAEEVYDSLYIENWKEIMSNSEIADIILNPSVDKLQKIVDIRDDSIFQRVLNILYPLIDSDEYDISHRVIEIINKKERELKRGILKSQITIKKQNAPQSDYDSVREENKMLREEFAKLAAKIEAMQKGAAAPVIETVDEVSIETETPVTNKPSEKRAVGQRGKSKAR